MGGARLIESNASDPWSHETSATPVGGCRPPLHDRSVTLPAPQAQSIWSALPQKDGSLLLGTGNEGKLLKVAGGAVTVLAETKALAVTSLVSAWGGAVAVGTLPEGKLMKWERGKLSELVALKGAQHIFSLAYDSKQNALYAATGPEGT